MSEGFKINKEYADRYNAWRQKEELQKLKDKYGDAADDSDTSSSSESEDEDAEALTEQVERDWLRTLAALKSKDPKIYKKDVKFYHDDNSSDGPKGKKDKKSEKPMFLKDYERKVILEKGGIVDEDEDTVTPVLRYDEEQEELRKNIVAAVGDSDEDSEDELLKPRQKSHELKQKEDADYLEWLKGQKDTPGADKDVGVELQPLKNYWQNKNLSESEKFLKNYILNKQFIDKDGELPTYDEIVDDDDEGLSDDEELLTQQDDFERKYNFRFEEPDAVEVKTFPRNVEETVRKKDTKRTDKRKEVQERKKLEKEKKKEELKQLKKLKRSEIMEKIEKLKEITGNKQLAFDEKELEEDFDPAKHDEMMQRCFDDGYYDEGEGEDVKPVFDMSDEEMQTENWDNWAGGDDWGGGGDEKWGGEDYSEPNVDDPGFCMDADYDPDAQTERKKTKKEKKRSKLAQALSAKKPVFDPQEKTFEEYFDEYYKLDYEDIIGDIPCRFKYRKVTPNNYGLSVDEVINSRDKELNAWVSVKKMSQYRTEDEEQADVRVFTVKGRNVRKKQHILSSLFESEEKDADEEVKTDKPSTTETSDSQTNKKKRKRNRKKKNAKQNPINSQDSGVGSQGDNNTTDSRDANDSNSPVKARNNSNDANDRQKSLIQVVVTGEEKKKKNRKDKKKQANGENIGDTVSKRDTDVNHSGHMSQTSPVVSNSDGKDVTDVNSKKRKHDDNDVAVSSSKKQKKIKKGDKVKGSDDVVSSSAKMESGMDNGVDRKGNKQTSSSGHVDVGDGGKQQHKKKNKKKKVNDKMQMSDERLKAYGINPKKYKYMSKDELFQMKPRKQ